MKGFLHNCLIANAMDKATNIENFTIKWSYAEVILGITIDVDLS